ncbi:MAG: hypothetical protein RR838_12135 [Clostridium sp.]
MHFGNFKRGCNKRGRKGGARPNQHKKGWDKCCMDQCCEPVDCCHEEYDCCEEWDCCCDDCCCPDDTEWCCIENFNCCSNPYIVGNNANVCINKCDCEVQVDLKVKKLDMVRIWGRVIDCNGQAVSEVLIKLVKPIPGGYQGVAHTITDCSGFYQFEVCKDNSCKDYLILASKEARGPERVVTGSGNCKDICSRNRCL